MVLSTSPFAEAAATANPSTPQSNPGIPRLVLDEEGPPPLLEDNDQAADGTEDAVQSEVANYPPFIIYVTKRFTEGDPKMVKLAAEATVADLRSHVDALFEKSPHTGRRLTVIGSPGINLDFDNEVLVRLGVASGSKVVISDLELPLPPPVGGGSCKAH